LIPYTFEDYMREELELLNKKYPPINYRFQRKANKNHICEVCNVEIHKNEYYWSYKPNPIYVQEQHKKVKVYDKWRKRCIDCEPRNHIELENIKED
jgi:hypothetical protein